MVMHLLLYYAQVLGCVCSSYTQPRRHDQRMLSQAKIPALASEFVLNVTQHSYDLQAWYYHLKAAAGIVSDFSWYWYCDRIILVLVLRQEPD